MEFSHKSVLMNECIEGLNIKPDGIYIDGTAGGGGHSYEIASKLTAGGKLYALDRDKEAVAAASERLKPFSERATVINANFSEIASVVNELKLPRVDGILMDIGVSSYQLDNPERGFSYNHDAPLDMRMSREQETSAATVINEYTEFELEDIIWKYGEERWAKRIARFIVEERNIKPIETTFELNEIIKKAVPAGARRDGPHPSKRTFQAIRIAVNNELGELETALNDGIELLSDGGRFAVITFHSLEDRIVKNMFAQRVRGCICPPDMPVCVCGKKPELKLVNRKPIVAGKDELEENPRSRSAKLRIAEKIQSRK